MAILWWETIHGTRAMSMLLLGRGWSLSTSRRRFFPSQFFVIRFYSWNFGDTGYRFESGWLVLLGNWYWIEERW